MVSAPARRQQVAYAKHQNPLTGLPGNLMIEQHLTRCVAGEGGYCVLYFDLDNFKAYNDVYGFESGDSVIRLLSEIIVRHVPTGEFVGHIGGDDFIAVLSSGDGEEVCKKVIAEFDQAVLSFYSESDVKSGFITARSRRGRQQRYPLLSLSVAGGTNGHHFVPDIYALSATLRDRIERHGIVRVQHLALRIGDAALAEHPLHVPAAAVAEVGDVLEQLHAFTARTILKPPSWRIVSTCAKPSPNACS